MAWKVGTIHNETKTYWPNSTLLINIIFFSSSILVSSNNLSLASVSAIIFSFDPNLVPVNIILHYSSNTPVTVAITLPADCFIFDRIKRSSPAVIYSVNCNLFLERHGGSMFRHHCYLQKVCLPYRNSFQKSCYFESPMSKRGTYFENNFLKMKPTRFYWLFLCFPMLPPL